MMKFFARRALIAGALLAVPAFGGTSITYSTPGWYIWMSGSYEGSPINTPVGGPYSEQSTCIAKGEEWAASDKKLNPPRDYKYKCTYHDKDWYGNAA